MELFRKLDTDIDAELEHQNLSHASEICERTQERDRRIDHSAHKSLRQLFTAVGVIS